MAPSKKKTTNANGDPNLTKPATLADAVLPVKIIAVPGEEEVFRLPRKVLITAGCESGIEYGAI
jgi:hypothetical protein